MDANSDCEKCRSPHKINNRECQQGFPRRAMFVGFHARILSGHCKILCWIVFAFRWSRNPKWPGHPLGDLPFEGQGKQVADAPKRFGDGAYSRHPNVYQIWQRKAEGLAIASPALQANALENSGMLDGAAMARKRASGCVFVFTIRRSNSGRSLDAQI